MSSTPQDKDAASQSFLRSLLAPEHALSAVRELGTTPLARHLSLPGNQLNGHWGSRCQGLWYGCAHEVECSCCCNRHG